MHTAAVALLQWQDTKLHLRSGTKLRKWMRCVLFFCPSHTKSGGQGLPRTIAIGTKLRKWMRWVLFTKLRKWMRCVLFFAQPCHTKSGAQGFPRTRAISIGIANAFALRY
jgi:hypothetical protein